MPIRMHFTAACAPLALLGLVSPVLSQPTTQLDPIVVTASRVEEPLGAALSDITIISGDELLQAGNASLMDVLIRQPGVQLSSSGGYRSSTGLLLRGASSSQTIVLIDGVRIGSVSNGSAALETLPLEAIERVEILRGPATALYGPDAVGGVVQIFTRSAGGEPRMAASLGAGSDGQRKASASLRGGSAGLGYNLGVSREKARGISLIDDPRSGSFNPDRDGFEFTSVQAGLSAELDARHALSVKLLHSEMTQRFDGTPFPNPLGLNRLTTDAIALPELTQLTALWKARWSSRWTSTLIAGTGHETAPAEYFRAFDGAFAGRSRFDSKRRQLSWQHDLALGSDTLSLALESRVEQVDSTTAFTQTRRTINGVMGSYSLRRGPADAQLVVRHDSNSQFGGFNNWALSGGYQLTERWRVVASTGTSFQAPSFNQLYFPNFGNPALQPQRNRGAEVGLRRQANAHRFSLSAYQNDIEGFIDPVSNVQSSSATLRGISARLDGQHQTLRYQVSYDYADPRSYSTQAANNGLRLLRVARHVVNARVSQTYSSSTVFAEVQLTSDRQDNNPSFTGRDTLAGYTLLNLGAQWHLNPQTTLNVRLNNVTDEDYRLASTYAMPGRHAFVWISWAN